MARAEVGGRVTGWEGSYMRLSISLAWEAAAEAEGGRYRGFLRGGPFEAERGIAEAVGSDILLSG